MKKLALDTLQVDSFVTAGEPPARGTVIGAEVGSTLPPRCVTFTCGDSHIRPCLDAA